MKSALACLLVGAISLLVLSGCPKKQIKTDNLIYDKELPPGAIALRKITDPAEIPDFTRACQGASTPDLLSAIDYSLEYLRKNSSQRYFPYGREITHDQAVASLQAFRQLATSGMDPAAMNKAIREKFDVWISVGCDDKGTVRFTGYYTPTFEASLTPTATFRYPLYSLPQQHGVNSEGHTVAMTQFTRQQIEQGGMLRGQELAYLDDPFKVYIVQVQGSARLKISGVDRIVGYTGSNDMEYHSIRQDLINDRKIDAGAASLQTMIAYFKADPQDIQRYTWRNPRYVFFAFSDDPNPRGSLNVPVTRFRSIATDKSVFPRACLAMVATRLPEGRQTRPYNLFTLDQDTGGAIRAAGRCDIYMGVGEQAAELAGRTVQDGKLYYLFLKSGSVPTPAAPTAPSAAGSGAPAAPAAAGSGAPAAGPVTPASPPPTDGTGPIGPVHR